MRNFIIDPVYLNPNANIILGINNQIGPFVTIGCVPQHRISYNDQNQAFIPSSGHVIIGHYNKIREFVSIHHPTQEEGGTCIGDHNFLMNGSHVGHDAIIEDHVVLTPNVVLAGHTYVMHHANLGLNSSVHQYCVIGAYAFVGMNTPINRHLPPFCLIDHTGRITLNLIGLKRNGFTEEEIKQISLYYSSVWSDQAPALEECSPRVRLNVTNFKALITNEVHDSRRTYPPPGGRQL